MSRFDSRPRFAIVGTGALGSELALNLARRGATDVLLLDPERLETRNLACSTFLSQAFAHASTTNDSLPWKAPLLQAEAARAFGLSWRSLVAEIADADLGLLADCDVLCSCTDSALARAETAYIARLLRLPMLDCGVMGDDLPRGRVTWFAAPHTAACYLCGTTEDRRAQLLAYAASASLGCAPVLQTASMTGSSDTVRHTARQATHLLERYRQQGFPQHSTAWQLSRQQGTAEWCTETVQLSRSDSCPWHSVPAPSLTELPWETPLAESLRQHFPPEERGVLQLHWPLCTDAVCRNCGAAAQPLRRVAAVRRTLHCHHCGSKGTLQPLASVHTIAPEDPLSACSPRQLHWPRQHRYLLRRSLAQPERSTP